MFSLDGPIIGCAMKQCQALDHTDENNRRYVEFVIEGEPASKANSRRMVLRGKRPMFIKSQKALDYCKLFAKQCPQLDELFTEDVAVTIKIFYGSRRPDLDESVILDEMQEKIYLNDRQVKRKTIQWGLDRERPRSYIRIETLESCDSTCDCRFCQWEKTFDTASPSVDKV